MVFVKMQSVFNVLDELEADVAASDELDPIFKKGCLDSIKTIMSRLYDLKFHIFPSCSYSKSPDYISCNTCDFHFSTKLATSLTFCPSCGRYISSWQDDYPF